MAWTIEYSETAKKQLKKLDPQSAQRVFNYMKGRVLESKDPRSAGKLLTGTLGGVWRYRVGDIRVLCEVQDDCLCILVLQIGNRRNVYHQ